MEEEELLDEATFADVISIIFLSEIREKENSKRIREKIWLW